MIGKKKGRQPSPRAQRPPPWSSWVSAVVHLQRRSKPHGVSEIVHFPIRNEVLFQSKEWAGLGLMIFLMIFLMKSRAGRPEISLRKSLRKSLSPAQPTPCFEKGPRSLLENGRFLRPHEAYSFFANGPLLRPKSSKGEAFELSGWAGDLFFSRSKKSIFSPMRLTPPLQMDHC